MAKSIHTPEYRRLREALVSVRESAELSQRELGARLGVPHSWVAKIEIGERRIDVIECCWFLAACGVTPSTVLPEILRDVLEEPRRSGRRTR